MQMEEIIHGGKKKIGHLANDNLDLILIIFSLEPQAKSEHLSSFSLNQLRVKLNWRQRAVRRLISLK